MYPPPSRPASSVMKPRRMAKVKGLLENDKMAFEAKAIILRSGNLVSPAKRSARSYSSGTAL